MARPTEEAQTHFVLANRLFGHLVTSSGDMGKLATGLGNMAQGLEKLSIGVRATYIELEEVKRLLQQQRR
jgi:hypothetical protein